jgi:hypothetical protein
VFDPGAVSEIVIAAAMKQSSVQYVGSFDNVRFDGPDQVLALGEPVAVYESGNDSAGFLRVELTASGASGVARAARVSWVGRGELEVAESLGGAWAPVQGAVSPLEVPLAQGGHRARFYRLRR